MQQSSVLAVCPSFSSHTTIGFADTATKVTQEFSDRMEDFGLESVQNRSPIQRYLTFSLQQQPEDLKLKQQVDKEEEEDEEHGFEFHPFCTDHDTLTISADEIFSNGQIRPFFQILNQEEQSYNKVWSSSGFSSSSPHHPRHCSLVNLMKEERESSSLSESPRSQALPGTFCVWKPSEVKCKKSNSTGTSKRWRLRDLISRSNSGSKETLVVLARSSTCSSSKSKKGDPEVGGDKSAHEIHYIRNRELKEVDRRRSYLPYKRDLIGFFANVNGLTKQLHPF